MFFFAPRGRRFKYTKGNQLVADLLSREKESGVVFLMYVGCPKKLNQQPVSPKTEIKIFVLFQSISLKSTEMQQRKKRKPKKREMGFVFVSTHVGTVISDGETLRQSWSITGKTQTAPKWIPAAKR